MSESVRVFNVSALADLREALVRFKDDAQAALSSVELELHRAVEWLDERQKHWRREIRKCEDAVHNAKMELSHKKVFPIFDRTPDTSQEEKTLKRAKERLREAEEKSQLCQRWEPQLRRAIGEYETHGRGLGGMLEMDLPRMLALLQRKIDALEAYQAVAAGGDGGPAA
jgi:DNA repair exonuclease SbcCD ATPase subunit